MVLVDGIMVPKDVHILISRTGNINLHGKGELKLQMGLRLLLTDLKIFWIN